MPDEQQRLFEPEPIDWTGRRKRVYECCGEPCGLPFVAPDFTKYPHAEGCENAALFDDDGKPRRLLWCSDSARLGGPCPYTGERARYMPVGGCCKDLACPSETVGSSETT